MPHLRTLREKGPRVRKIAGPQLRPSFWSWRNKFNDQTSPVAVGVVAFSAFLGQLLPCLSHLLQLFAMIERSRPCHIAAFSGIAAVLFDFFQNTSFA